MKTLPSSSFQFKCGIESSNRFMLAPMTNTQSHEDGTLAEDEYRWLTMRAKGGFGITMTCASHVQEVGKGFPGQLGIFSDNHIEGHRRLSTEIKALGSVAIIQLHHAGMRSPEELIGENPVCPSDQPKYSARGLSLAEVHQLRDDFITAAIRARASGYDGVEVHGAHGYILTQFLSSKINNRTDQYGGNLENRSHLLFEIVNGIRESCGPDFLLGIRLSPERFGMKLAEVKQVTNRLIDEGNIDFLDISLWDVFKQPEEEEHKDKSLLEHFTGLNRGEVKLTVAGNIRTGKDVNNVLQAGVDFVSIGRAAILHHDFPNRVMDDPDFMPVKTPVTKEYLSKEGLGEDFISYMKRWEGFVANDH
ncbi:NADH:flavin oxidoreductase [Lentiprolixibacter aurantiacus]|uniref:NADH:flavin oxidoreductase n=1 Tax=Lentiprolixibacter aurantiacus TaxID=2993939 RepID=A0AAE3SN70_9FLAO|nr:NADH:flavin oxidoreductase [Lentiprolixibacter aurantiacus]MCX2719190.1 NADH:flavin oxidoreductase [Lentiprolixibacter aurantiacus]